MEAIPATLCDLDAAPLLLGLDPGLRERLTEGAIRHDCPDRTLLFEEGAGSDRLYFLCAGIVELFTCDSDRDAVMAIVWPPEALIPAAAMMDAPFLVSARTLGRAQLLSLDAELVRQEACRDAAFAWGLNQILAAQFRMLQRSLKELKLRDATQRLGAFLLRLIDVRGKHGCADLPVPKYVLASRLGMAAESLSRSLQLLREHGLIVRGSRAILVDRAAFERFCRPDPLIDGREPALFGTAT